MRPVPGMPGKPCPLTDPHEAHAWISVIARPWVWWACPGATGGPSP
jgi:hypothetical protein